MSLLFNCKAERLTLKNEGIFGSKYHYNPSGMIVFSFAKFCVNDITVRSKSKKIRFFEKVSVKKNDAKKLFGNFSFQIS